jgi:hypothetical protein
MLFVIKNLDTGKYTARPGLSLSYTVKLEELRLFINHAAAQAECSETKSSRN